MPRKLHSDRLMLNELKKRIRELENEIIKLKSQKEFCNVGKE